MPIIINIYYSGTGDNAIKFAKEMVSSGIVKDIRSEPGNLKYEYYVPLNDSNSILLIDAWSDQQALDAHHASPLMSKITALRNKYDLHMRVERYLPDDNGIPQSDRQFISY